MGVNDYIRAERFHSERNGTKKKKQPQNTLFKNSLPVQDGTPCPHAPHPQGLAHSDKLLANISI